jgi:hypothetical protein
MRRLFFLLLPCLLLALPVGAQTVTNPTGVTFTASVDHATLTKYVIGYFLSGATNPLQEADLPLGTPDAQQIVTASINARPLGYGTYTAKVRAVAGAMTSDWSLPSNDFTRTPLPPAGAPVVKK